MPTPDPDHRKSGIPRTGRLPWGTHFCQFYRKKEELLELLVPYFRAGLAGNEYCVWVTPKGLDGEIARRALATAVPGCRALAGATALEIVPYGRWLRRGGKSGRAILAALDHAIASGFDGVRLACPALPDTAGGKAFSHYGADAIRDNNVVAAFAYPRDSFDALGLMEVVKEHRFALVRDTGGWEVIESKEARSVRDELKRSEDKLKSLFSNMLEGFSYHRIILDARGRPCDYVFLQVNSAFERLTGLRARDVVGKRATAVLPGIEKDPADWIGQYGKVALTGKPVRFEGHAARLKRDYAVSAFSPQKGYFAVTFTDVTERRRAEETIRYRNVTLDGMARIFREALSASTEEEFGRACLAVAEEVTRSRFGFIGEIGADGMLHDLAISDPGWELCTMHDKAGHRRPPGDFSIHGLYGRVIRDGKGFFTNDPASHPASIGTPEGHPPLRAFLGTPLIRDGKTIGMVGMGNREGGYRSEDLDALKALAGAIMQALLRKRAEERIFDTGKRLEALMNALPVGVTFSDDATCRHITGNPAALAQFEVGADDNLSASSPDRDGRGRRVRYLRGEAPMSSAELPLQRAVAENRAVAPMEIEIELASGRRWFAEASGAPLHDRHGNVVGGVAVTVDVTGRKRAEEALRASVVEKEILLKELAHRTKNNMQVIASLLSLQAGASADPEFVSALADTQDRIRAMALVHERLYRSGNFASVNMRDYVGDILASLLRAGRGVGPPARTVLDMEDIFVSIDEALPCGLIINELVSNSLKHAFAGQKAGTVFLSLRRLGESIELRYRDDGPGLAPDLDLSRTRSLGLKLVYNLAVRQLRGTMEIRRDPVTEFVLTFGGRPKSGRT